MISSEQYSMNNLNMIQLTWHEHINPTILACNMMTLYAPFILLGLPRNHHMHHLPTSDITQSPQDQIKLGINNTVVIVKWPQGAWSLPTILAKYHEYPTTRYPRYHGDHSGDHNHDQHLVSNTHRALVSWLYQNMVVASHHYLKFQGTIFSL